MVKHGDISAHVVVDGVELPEYVSEYDEHSKKLRCWIASEAGKVQSTADLCGILSLGFSQEFTLRLKRETSDYHSGTKFFVDGQCVLCIVGDNSLFTCSGLRNGVRSQRPLLFANTEISDDDALLEGSVPAEVGTISIEHWHIEMGGLHVRKDPKWLFKPTGPVHERTKPVGHVTTLGDERPCSKKPFETDIKYIKHLITFVFQYRPYEYLRANGIAPRLITVENPTLDDAKPIPPPTSGPRGKKRKGLAVRDFIDLTEDNDGTEAHAGEVDDEEQAAIDELKAELEIKRMELQLSKLERQKRKRAKLAGPSSTSRDKEAPANARQEKSKRSMVKEESV